MPTAFVWSLLAAAAPSPYQAVHFPPPAAATTWVVLDRDGANREVPKYLSSLGMGEAGTGVMTAPSFRVGVDTISFTICGHDGMGGGQKKNFIALVDAKTGDVLRQTMAPGSDSLQPQSWPTAELRDRAVRIEVHDGHAGGAYAWLGIGSVNAGPALTVDFRQGLPAGWTERAKPRVETAAETLTGGIPFRRYPAVYTLVPAAGSCTAAVGGTADRIFLLGGTVPAGKPLDIYGYVDVVYRSGAKDSFPLMFGFTLDQAGKMLSTSKAMHLHASADAFQHYLVLTPRPEVIETIVLRRNPEQPVVPRITAVTCQTTGRNDMLHPLPAADVSDAERAWIATHALTSTSPAMAAITAEIRRAHKVE